MGQDKKKIRVALACQGGGSHTAFTAGVLHTFLTQDTFHKDYEIMGLSGTSGGALCAALVWYSLLREKGNSTRKAHERLLSFWRDNSATLLWEKLIDLWGVSAIRWQEAGVVPHLDISPYSFPMALFNDYIRTLAPRQEFFNLKLLLEKHIDFDELAQFQSGSCGRKLPRLIVGAADILSGGFKTFDSWHGEIGMEALLATTAIPTLFKAVETKDGKAAYWDGLFSENPPISFFVKDIEDKDDKPEEIWIIQINPYKWDAVPASPKEISDRRNQLSGNLSLYQEIDFIQTVNGWVDDSRVSLLPRYRKIALRRIPMSLMLTQDLDTASKLERDGSFIERLIDDGRSQARLFLQNKDRDDQFKVPDKPARR